jgi:hypothetical protein
VGTYVRHTFSASVRQQPGAGAHHLGLLDNVMTGHEFSGLLDHAEPDLGL